MMNTILELVTLIKADTAIVALIGQHIYPEYTTYSGDCIVYSGYTISNDKKKKHVSFKITVLASSLESANAIDAALDDLLLTLGDKPLTTKILQVEQTGGGLLFEQDTQTYRLVKQLELIAAAN